MGTGQSTGVSHLRRQTSKPARAQCPGEGVRQGPGVVQKDKSPGRVWAVQDTGRKAAWDSRTPAGTPLDVGMLRQP